MLFKRFVSTPVGTLPPSIRQILTSGQDSAQVQVHGWIRFIRRQKNVTFAVVNDGSCASGLQTVLHNNLNTHVHGLTNGASVRMTGKIVPSPGVGQAQELQVNSLEILGECNPDVYPIQKQALTLEYLRDHAHLRPRTEANAAMLRLRNVLVKSLHSFFETQDFCYAHTPILTASDCEGAGETFRVIPSAAEPTSDAPSEFFSKPAYLSVSAQLHLEALAASLARVYTLSPCFRAERSQTNRHLAEFWMLEAEWAWTRHIDDVCGVIEGCIKHALNAGHEERAALAKGIPGQEERAKQLESAASDKSWPRITYTEAVSELETYHTSMASRVHPFVFAPKWGHALQSEHEKWLSEVLVKGPVFVTDYPKTLKPFYMRANGDDKTVACVDLLVPFVGELVGGSVREDRLELLQQTMVSHGLDPAGEEYSWYVDLRRYGSAPHSGFGLGLERLVSWVSGIENVRECIAMPRWAKRMLL